MMDAIEAASQEAGFTPDQIRAMRHTTHCDYYPRPDQIERGVNLGIYFSCKSNGIWRGSVKAFLRDYGECYLEAKALFRLGKYDRGRRRLTQHLGGNCP